MAKPLWVIGLFAPYMDLAAFSEITLGHIIVVLAPTAAAMFTCKAFLCAFALALVSRGTPIERSLSTVTAVSRVLLSMLLLCCFELLLSLLFLGFHEFAILLD